MFNGVGLLWLVSRDSFTLWEKMLMIYFVWDINYTCIKDITLYPWKYKVGHKGSIQVLRSLNVWLHPDHSYSPITWPRSYFAVRKTNENNNNNFTVFVLFFMFHTFVRLRICEHMDFYIICWNFSHVNIGVFLFMYWNFVWNNNEKEVERTSWIFEFTSCFRSVYVWSE